MEGYNIGAPKIYNEISKFYSIAISHFQLCDGKSCRFQSIYLFFKSIIHLYVFFFYSIVIALPTIGTAVVVTLSLKGNREK